MADRSVVIRLRGEIGDLQAKMVAAGKSIQHTADKMTGAEKEAVKFRKGLTDLGSAGGKVGLVAAAGIAVAVKAFADFDQAMSGVQAATHAAGQEMKDLRGLALQTGADTAFSAVEAADGIEQLAKAGVSTGDIMGGALQGALDLAAAGTIAVGDAAETAATAMTQFGLAGSRVPHIADLLAAAAGKAQGEVSDIAMALKQSGLVADQVGLTIEETTGALASFASAGLLGSDAGTSFKTMLMRLLPTTKEAGDAMEAIGFSAFDANGNMKSLTEIAGGLQKGLSKMTAEQRQATLQTIFGQDAIRAATVLYEQGADGIQSWIDKVDDQGYAAETAAIKMDNLAGDIEKLKGALSTLLIQQGEAGNGFLRGAVQNTEDFVNALAEMPDWANKGASSLLAITAVVGGSLWFGSKVVNGITSTRAALADLNLTAEQSARAMGVAKAAAGVFAVYMAADFVNDLATVDVSMRRMNAGFAELAAGKNPEQFRELSLGVGDLADTLHRAAYLDFDLFGTEKDQVKEMDEALASLAETDLSSARDTFAGIVKVWTDQGNPLEDLIALFPEYEIALTNAEDANWNLSNGARGASRALDETEGSAGRAERGLSGVETAADRAAFQAEELDSVLGDLEVTLAGKQRSRAYEQSLDDLAERFKERRDLLQQIADAQSQLANPDMGAVGDAQADVTKAQRELAAAKTASAKESAREQLANARERLSDAQASIGESADVTRERIKDLKDQLSDFKLTLNEGEQAGRDWNSALEDIALNAQEAAQDLDGMDRVKYLNNAREDFIDLATKITGSREKAKELADELGLLHRTEAKPKIEVDTKPAEADVRKFYRWLEGLPPATVKLMVKTIMGKNDIGESGDPRFQRAQGGPIYGPGSSTSDSIPALLSNGEYVIRAAAVSKYGEGLFRQLNAMRFAEGGYVRQIAAQGATTNYCGSGSEIDYDRLALALSRVRPMYGDVHVSGDGSFRRELLNDQRASSLSGVR